MTFWNHLARFKPARGVALNPNHNLYNGLIHSCTLREGTGLSAFNDVTGLPYTVYADNAIWTGGGLDNMIDVGDYVDMGPINMQSWPEISIDILYRRDTTNVGLHPCSNYRWNSASCWVSHDSYARIYPYVYQTTNSYTPGYLGYQYAGYYHVIISFYAKEFKWICNGQLVHQTTPTYDEPLSTVRSSARNFTLGRWLDNSSSKLEGAVSFFRMWDRALSLPEMYALAADPFCMFKRSTRPRIFDLNLGGAPGNIAVSIDHLIQAHVLGGLGIGGFFGLTLNSVAQAQALPSETITRTKVAGLNSLTQAQAVTSESAIKALGVTLGSLTQVQALSTSLTTKILGLTLNSLTQGQVVSVVNFDSIIDVAVNHLAQAQALSEIGLSREAVVSINPLAQGQALDDVDISMITAVGINSMGQMQTIPNFTFGIESIVRIYDMLQVQQIETVLVRYGGKCIFVTLGAVEENICIGLGEAVEPVNFAISAELPINIDFDVMRG